MRRFRLVLSVLVLSASASAAGAQTIFSGSGATTATAVNDFRAALGALNPNVAGSFNGGRREINWDGVPDAFAAPNSLPPNFFNVNSPRGVVFSTSGTGFEVSGNAGVAPIEFDNINASYSTLFTTFSPQRLFTAIDSNTLDISFFIPGTNTPALTNGFGSVFTDVDLANITSFTFFGVGNAPLGTFFVPNVAGANGTLSFLGVLFSSPIISRVRITTGNAALGAGTNETGAVDLVVMDDFIYGEPVGVPEPGSWVLMATGFAFLGWRLRQRSTAQPAGLA
jgi:hypothetical protein